MSYPWNHDFGHLHEGSRGLLWLEVHFRSRVCLDDRSDLLIPKQAATSHSLMSFLILSDTQAYTTAYVWTSQPYITYTLSILDPLSFGRQAFRQVGPLGSSQFAPRYRKQGHGALLDISVLKIAIANPQHAPYSRAAVAALKYAGLYDRLADRFVMGENVSQAAQFVESGNAQAGFVALAHALSPSVKSMGKFWMVPADYYPPLAQGG